MAWQEISPGLLCCRDSCNVYALVGSEGTVLVDAGTGRWLDAIDQLPLPPLALLCTHYFRDHSAGAVEAARRGIAVYVPEGEAALFTNPTIHFAGRENNIIYDNQWDFFSPIEPVDIAGVLQDYATISLAGIELKIIPLPGATLTQVGFMTTLAKTGQRIIFTGETIHSPGKVYRVAPLQYNYNDLAGAANVHFSADRLKELKPDLLLPGIGYPIQDDIPGALTLLQHNMRQLCVGRPAQEAQLRAQASDELVQVSEHVWQSTQAEAITSFLQSKSGKVLAIDYGYLWKPLGMPNSTKHHARRALLHSMDALKRQLGADQIDVVLVSHYHDDHVSGIPNLQRLFDTQCWAGANFSALLQNPRAHCYPCNWPQAIRVDRALPLGEPIQWEEYTFHLSPMDGHTRYSTLICFEADGLRFAHTGDQYFFHRAIADADSYRDNLMARNFVYRNGATHAGYRQSATALADWQPDVVLSGHFPAYRSAPAFHEALKQWDSEYQHMHHNAMPLEPHDMHWDIDSWQAWLWPYRLHLPAPGQAVFTATVRNPLPTIAEMTLTLVGPNGCKGTPVSMHVDPRAESACQVTLPMNHTTILQPIGLDITVNGQPIGQVTEAIVSVG